MSHLDADLIETLLYRSENETLDFKRDQYPIANATDDQKSELIKDILAFANAWKTEDAYILIGVLDGNGGKATPVGQVTHTDDATLQQLVNSKTNRPVAFEYIPTTYEGKSIAAIKIRKNQNRPLYLRKKFGKVNAKTVYIRRGSSTAVADPDEISSMGFKAKISEPTLKFGLRRINSEDSASMSLELNSTILNIESPSRRGMSSAGGNGYMMLSIRPPSLLGPKDEEIELYSKEKAMFRAVLLEASNIGQSVAQDVQVQLRLPLQRGFYVRNRPPKRPRRLGTVDATVLRERLTLTRSSGHYLINVRLGKIQPGMTTRSRPFWLGSEEPLTVHLAARVMGDNIPKPIETTFSVAITTDVEHITINEARNALEKDEEDNDNW